MPAPVGNADAPPPALPVAPPPGSYAPPPAQYQPPGYGPPPVAVPQYGTGGYSPYTPTDGNTSGMGPGYNLPADTQGWSFAGFVPWGLFSFFNGNPTWGAIGLVLSVFGFYIVYCIYIGVKGKEMAWQGRRFESIEQFNETMRAWNTWGLVLLCLSVLAVLLYILLVFGIIFAGLAGELD
jgi:hypothetical protein